MNKRRLLKLADLLEADARKRRGIKFNLYTVGTVDVSPEDGKVKLDCGTQACAMGLAALSGAFKRAGLGYKLHEHDGFFGSPTNVNVSTTINGRMRDYERAAMLVFDLTKKQAAHLFTPSEYPEDMSLMGGRAERFVAKRIRDFVAGKVAI